MEKLNLVYSIKKDDWLEGYDLGYKLFRKKFTVLKAAIFLIPIALFIDSLVRDPYFTVGYVCIAVCLGAMFCIFATPKMQRRTSEHALDELEGDTYNLKVFDDKLTVETVLPEGETPPPPTVISLDDKSLRAVETENIIGVFTKEISLVLPKSAMNQNDLDILRKTLKI